MLPPSLSRLKPLIKNFKTDWEIREQQCCSIMTQPGPCVFPRWFIASLGGNSGEGCVLGWDPGLGRWASQGWAASLRTSRLGEPQGLKSVGEPGADGELAGRSVSHVFQQRSLPLCLPPHRSCVSGSAPGTALVEYQAALSLPHQKHQRRSAECSAGSGVRVGCDRDPGVSGRQCYSKVSLA